ncbi:metal ABC transporter solute-binding protein, Zn/Mn family [Pannonibacter sp. SL95]|uniref:metal ABC transporter solute-binding protein, Zn/Mn family n=1 Tax=Pannonibacter sp. SL95 TaxID=2995153 RepID=UPI002275F268|nr:zinc ABC transporter substrate-binding protein [Pannonibacter sp. SL95]MCY1704896.1 zinc ABC transporter substrate-binding protein [Pannonibacter sp. SL95]
MVFARRGILKSALIAVTVLLSGGVPALSAAPLTVVATTGMIADAARAVGGDAVTVTALMGPGVDPHSYRQTRSDIVAMAKADLVLWHGLYLEAQMEDFFADLGKKRRVVAVAEAVDKSRLLGHQNYAGRYDPHVWMDPALWTGVVVAVRDALTEAQPAEAAAFKANAEAYLAELAALDTYSREVLASVPQGSRVLLTAHDAFSYFGRAYGYEVIGIQGISTQSEAGLNRVSELVDLLVSRKIAAVFVESSVSDRNIRALIEGAAAKGHEVRIGGELFSDAMGETGTYEGTYLGMIDHNVTLITRASGGTAPADGRTGRLSAGL